MRLTAILAGVFLCVLVFFAGGSIAKAEAPQQILLANSTTKGYGFTALELAQEQKAVQEAPKPKEHPVATGETLVAIAKQYETTWQRLYAKNPHVANPDVIDVGQVLVIPQANEQLTERVLPQPVEVAQPAVKTNKPVAAKSTRNDSSPKPAATAVRGSGAGNTYSAGYCTWYAKSRRPDLPNNLGNANTWASRAQAQGIPTSSVPRAGAIGQRGMHVVYVESVNADGTVSISEMNHKGWNVVSSRTVPAGYFQYIY